MTETGHEEPFKMRRRNGDEVSKRRPRSRVSSVRFSPLAPEAAAGFKKSAPKALGCSVSAPFVPRTERKTCPVKGQKQGESTSRRRNRPGSPLCRVSGRPPTCVARLAGGRVKRGYGDKVNRSVMSEHTGALHASNEGFRGLFIGLVADAGFAPLAELDLPQPGVIGRIERVLAEDKSPVVAIIIDAWNLRLGERRHRLSGELTFCRIAGSISNSAKLVKFFLDDGAARRSVRLQQSARP
jgi:hypothetical protein